MQVTSSKIKSAKVDLKEFEVEKPAVFCPRARQLFLKAGGLVLPKTQKV